MEAGCKKEEWVYENKVPIRYYWTSTGKLLETGVCIKNDYDSNFAPENEPTVYITIEYQRVRDVDPKAQTLSIDFTLVMRWIDSRVNARFSPQNRRRGGILIRKNAMAQLWIPDFQVWNRTSLKIEKEWASLIRSKVLASNDINAVSYTHLTLPTILRV